ncbi:cyclic nucleotide-binding domain-containing protein [Hymenobacter sp. BT559]|nr:cyclic nucleotide-binding domain-containing protein [Hymenobacter sp. BT559]
MLGVRPDETRTVWLFFLHNFLLGIGTILVYVAANVILLENNPERNLPLAYGTAALAMMAAGRVYTYFEHHLVLQKLAGRVLVAVVVLAGVLGALVLLGHSVAAAVAIMAGYRVIYLLTNLEFWGVSAVVFDVRQSKRLFGLISAGDMPAKALGAGLAIIIHAHTDLLYLLLTAFAAYGAALLVVKATLRSHDVEARPVGRRQRVAGTSVWQRWFGNNQLVLSICLSLTAIAAVTTGVEYSFFVNVKHKFHDQTLVMRYVGGVLALTYLLAMLFKVGLAQVTLDRLGIRRMLLTLPGTVLAGLLAFGALSWLGAGESTLLIYFCGLYLGLEVLRRAVFDPVFLVLFQPLAPPERLQAHTLAKGYYEPLGMGLAGLLLFFTASHEAIAEWLPFVWMALFMAGALFFLARTYGHYLAELQHSLSQRFSLTEELRTELPTEPMAAVTQAPTDLAEAQELTKLLTDKKRRAAATSRLLVLGPAAVPALVAALQPGTPEPLARRSASVAGQLRLPEGRRALVALAQQPHPTRREVALRALRGFAPVAADAPIFQGLVEDELRLAQRLLHGLAPLGIASELARALDYELDRIEQRIFGLLQQLYPPQLIVDAQRGVAHAARERQANALEILDNLIPRPWYQGLQALLDVSPAAEKAQVFDQLLGPLATTTALPAYIIQQGEVTFSDWTVAVALRQHMPTLGQLPDWLPYFTSPNALLQESALTAINHLATSQHTIYNEALRLLPALPQLLMSHHAAAAHLPAQARVGLLRHTALFAETPENVLSSIVPIMQEVTFPAGHQIFAKGDLGASLYIVYEGEVGIFNGPQLLTTFRQGDFFGELALLDAEPRSATAVAQSAVRAFRLDQDDFYDVMEERGEVLRNILRVLCQRLRRQNEA